MAKPVREDVVTMTDLADQRLLKSKSKNIHRQHLIFLKAFGFFSDGVLRAWPSNLFTFNLHKALFKCVVDDLN